MVVRSAPVVPGNCWADRRATPVYKHDRFGEARHAHPEDITGGHLFEDLRDCGHGPGEQVVRASMSSSRFTLPNGGHGSMCQLCAFEVYDPRLG
jgi:hypothetical protein